MTLSRPGTQLARRPLQFVLLADCSGSMAADGKIRALNTAIREVLPHLGQVAAENPHVDLLFSAVAFSTTVRWHVERPTPIDQIVWHDLVATGHTNLGAALVEVASRVGAESTSHRGMAPAIVLVSDGQPTDNFRAGLDRLLQEPYGAAAARIAVAIGRDADLRVLSEFQGGGDPLHAHNPEQLVQSIRWASTAATRAASELQQTPAHHGPITWRSQPTDEGEQVW